MNSKFPRPLIMFGSTTGIGKTVTSGCMVRAGLRLPSKGRVAYIKPLQTGAFDQEDPVADAANVLRLVGDLEKTGRFDRKTLWCWAEAVSPHLAAERAQSGQSGSPAKWRRPPPSDEEVRARTVDAVMESVNTPEGLGLAVVETAGGVLSPAASRSLQADVYNQMGYAAVVVGDPRLGGISTTLTALESLAMRNYDIAGIVLIGDTKVLGNADYLKYWLDQGNLKRIREEGKRAGKIIPSNSATYTDSPKMILLPSMPPKPTPLMGWLKETDGKFDEFVRGYVESAASR